MRKLLISLLLTVSLFGQSATPIVSQPDTYSYANVVMEAQAVPTSPTVITTRNLRWGGGWISCTGSQAITMTDGNGINLIPAVPWSGPQVISLNLFAGSYISGGFSISASATGCAYHAFWKGL
jgi:hypothetical protein